MALFPVVILAVFVGMWLMRRGSSLTRACRWRLDRAGGDGHWRCAACGAACDLAPGRAPRSCLRARP